MRKEHRGSLLHSFCEENMFFVSQASSFFGSGISQSHAPRKTLDKDQILKSL
jgi:hypothetical protein